MPKTAAQEWHNTYQTGRLSNVQPLIWFSRAKELTEFKKQHGLRDESHKDALLRTARQIVGKRKIQVIYRPGKGLDPAVLIFKNA